VTRIRNAWAVLTGKATICTHANHNATGNYATGAIADPGWTVTYWPGWKVS